MPLLSAKEVRNLKLSSIPLEQLKSFSETLRQGSAGSATDIIKRLIELGFSKIDEFFNKEKVSSADEVVFSFARKTYTAVSKVLIISQ